MDSKFYLGLEFFRSCAPLKIRPTISYFCYKSLTLNMVEGMFRVVII